MTELLERVYARLFGEPDRYVATLSRGSAQLPDVVLTRSAGSVDLAPLLANLPDDPYDIRFLPLHCEGSRDCTQRPLLAHVAWSHSDGRPSLVQDLPAGLYEVTINRPPGRIGPNQARCWVLLAPEADSMVAQERYRAGANVVAGWGPDVDASTKRGFMRALLEALSES